MRPLRHNDPSGTPVAVVMWDQSILHTRTRSVTWSAGPYRHVVYVEGVEAAVLVKRCHIDYQPKGG